MSGPQIHLLLNHVPVIGIWFAAAILALALATRSVALARLGAGVLVVIALAGIPVYLSGEPAEHMIEHAAGVSERLIHDHEDLAKVAFLGLDVLGLLGLFSLLRHRGPEPRRGFLSLLLLITVVLGGVFAVTAHRGGLIRHPELRSDFQRPAGGHEGD